MFNRQLAAIAIAAALLGGCGIDNTGANTVGTNLLEVSSQPIIDIDADTMRAVLGDKVGPTDPVFGIKSYRVVYRTHDDFGNEVNASGLLSVPVPTAAFLQARPDYTMSIVSDQHGTIFSDEEAPTTAALATHQPDPIATAFTVMAGFVTLQPDYIGFGASRGFHPFLQEKSLANSVVDMITASIKFANQAQLPINGQIFLCGYSEGGVATLDAAKAIEASHPELHLKGVAPMEGPYDMNLTFSGVFASLLDQNSSNDQFPYPVNAFGGDIVYAFGKTYGIDLETMVQPPLPTLFPTLYNGEHTDADFAAQLPDDKNDFFQRAFVIDFMTNPDNVLKKAVIENSPIDWQPTTPTRLYHCKGDPVVPIQIAQVSAARMGVDVIQVDSDAQLLGHRECAVPAYTLVVGWFDALRSGN